MHRLSDFPRILFVVSLAVLWLTAQIGVSVRRRAPLASEDERDDFNIVLTSTLTLLGLIIGFTFSMAIGRYDARKIYEATEANVIGTEYVRAGLLGPADAERAQDLLKKYLAERVLFYTARDARQLPEVNARTAQLQEQLWSVVQGAATKNPSPITMLVTSGMNEVLDSAGYTQAAWLDRVPTSAWGLMIIIAVCCNLLVGYGARGKRPLLLIVLPFVLSVAFLLIADIDSPRSGIIRVRPENLMSLSQSLNSR